MIRLFCVAVMSLAVIATAMPLEAAEYTVTETDEEIRIETPQLEAAVRKKGYVSGVARQSFLDKKTGFRDPGFGLDVVDWIMEPGSDEEYRDQISPDHIVYHYGDKVHGNLPKRAIEGPQICTQARELSPVVIRGRDFVAVKQQYKYRTAAPGKNKGSLWTQILVFPVGKRYFVSMDKIDSVNNSDGMFLRIDLPGHLRHNRGDSFAQIYLSYFGLIPASEFFEDFAPDEKFLYSRDSGDVPERFIRAYQLRDSKTGKVGPWLAGMTLDPQAVYEAWCHQRGYVCFIQEFGGRPIRAGQSFSAAFVVGYFDSLGEMCEVYDQYKGFIGLEVSESDWELAK